MAGPFDDFKRWLLNAAPPATIDNSFEFEEEDEEREPTDEEVARATQGLIQTARTAVHLKRAYPPAPHDEATSHVGGLPRMPADLAWPRHEKMGWTDEGRGPLGPVGEWSMNFAAQIDLADLPWFPDRVLLPRDGALYFFVNTQYRPDHEGWVKVLYSPEPPSAHPVRQPPPDLMPIRDYDGHQPYPWLPIDDPRSRIFDRYVLEPMPISSYHPDTGYCERAWSLGRGHEKAQEALEREALLALEPAQPWTFHQAPGLKDSAWPYAGIFVSTATDILPHATKLSPHRSSHFVGPYLGEAAERTRAEYERLFQEAEIWRARAPGDFETLPPADHAAFRAWWASVEDRFTAIARDAHASEQAAVKRWEAVDGRQGPRPDAQIPTADHLRNLLTRSIELALETCYRHSPEAGALIPAETVDHLKHFYRNIAGGLVPEHQMLGYGLVGRGEPQADETVLLLQLSAHEDLHWLRPMFLQVWISPRDLAERRFDRAYGILGS